MFINRNLITETYRFIFKEIYFFWELFKKIEFNLRKIIYKLLGRTVNINSLKKKGDVIAKLIFKGEIYFLFNKKDINNKKFKYFREARYKIPNYYIYIIKNGIIKSGSNSIFSSLGKKISGINFQEIPFDYHIIKNLKNLNIKYLDGILLVLGVGSIERNYYHSWTEFAARAYATKLANLEYDYILINNDNKFTREILEILDFPHKKIIISSNYSYLSAKKIIYPELINNYQEILLNGITVYHNKYLPSWLKFLYEDVSKNKYLLNSQNSFEKIYISRRNKDVRNIINEKDLILNLENLGFKTIYFEDYSIKEQIRIAQLSNQIVAIHGAGLANINFCRKGTKVLELLPYYYQNQIIYMNAILMELDYSFYIGIPSNKLWRERPLNENFKVDVEIINDYIKDNW